jgi:hypothetical protein
VTETIAPVRGSSARTMIAAFVPYLAVAVVHLVILATGPAWAVTATKALLMPLLVVAVVSYLAVQGPLAAGVLLKLRTERW